MQLLLLQGRGKSVYVSEKRNWHNLFHLLGRDDLLRWHLNFNFSLLWKERTIQRGKVRAREAPEQNKTCYWVKVTSPVLSGAAALTRNDRQETGKKKGGRVGIINLMNIWLWAGTQIRGKITQVYPACSFLVLKQEWTKCVGHLGRTWLGCLGVITELNLTDPPSSSGRRETQPGSLYSLWAALCHHKRSICYALVILPYMGHNISILKPLNWTYISMSICIGSCTQCGCWPKFMCWSIKFHTQLPVDGMSAGVRKLKLMKLILRVPLSAHQA